MHITTIQMPKSSMLPETCMELIWICDECARTHATAESLKAPLSKPFEGLMGLVPKGNIPGCFLHRLKAVQSRRVIREVSITPFAPECDMLDQLSLIMRGRRSKLPAQGYKLQGCTKQLQKEIKGNEASSKDISIKNQNQMQSLTKAMR